MVREWLSFGMGVVSFGQGLGSGSPGTVSCASDSISYHVEGVPAQGSDVDYPVVVLEANASEMGPPLGPGYAQAAFNLKGTFDAADEGPPVLANVRLYCSSQQGFGDWYGLNFVAQGLETPLGTPEDPHLQFQCRLELKAAANLADAILHFVLDVNQSGNVDILDTSFEYGNADLDNDGTRLWVTYDPARHG
jgi:hypothetical protein